jgi:UDP-N-acetylglucosamine--N-acetylmuramyl-(pentapeptide) pyrophosphoryl-undecaprenol N-acetylglucosamine transferase
MRVVIAGGGTGGHFFPAVAVAEKLKEKGAEVLYIGSVNGVEFRKREVVEDFSPVFLNVAGIRGKGLKALKNAFNVMRSVRRVGGIFHDFKPDKVLIFGGYASLPVGLAAIFWKVPLFIQEQNSIPGKTNLYLSKFSCKVFVGFRKALEYFKEKGVYTGNPVRKEVVEFSTKRAELRDKFLRKFSLSSDKKTLLIFGGSQGALWINEKFLKVSHQLSQFADKFQVIHITGGKLTDRLKEKYESLGIKSVVLPFYERIWELYVVADCAVSRSGAMSIAELSCFGIPTLFIPYPYAVDDHQYYNALEIYKSGGCFLERQDSLTDKRFVQLICELLFDRMTYQKFSEKMKRFSNPTAADEITEMLLDERVKETC